MKKGFFPKLAAGNIRKNAKTYIPYILTCIVTVSMFYIVKSLSLNPGLGDMVGGNFVNTSMVLGSWVVALFAFIFLFYTNSFLVKHRKKEFGVFNILGMERRHLARVVRWETVYVALISLSLGLGLGLALDKAMFLLLIRIIGRDIPLGFFVSGEAVGETILFFAIIFLFIYVNSARQIRAADPVELLRAGNVGEKEPGANWLLTLLGLAAMGGGYYIAITTQDPIASVLLFFVAVLLVIAGTYLLFTAGSIALLKALRKNKRYYYRTRHFVSVSGMIYRMKQNAVGLANICILSTMVLVMLSSTTSLMVGIEEIIRNRYPVDFTFYCEDGTRDMAAEQETVRRLREEQGLHMTNEWEYIYLAFQAIRDGNGYSVFRERARSVEDDTNSLFFVPLSDYNAVMGEEKTLGQDEILIFSNRGDFNYQTLKLFGKEYRIVEHLDSFVGNGRYESLMSVTQYIIVPDMDTIYELYDRQKAILTNLASSIGWVYGFDTDAGAAEQTAFGEALQGRLALEGTFYLETREEGRAAFLDIVGGLFFIGMFLGILFIMATVLIIYYKQISEGYDDRNRFEIMQKVGMSRDEVKASIHSQILTVFFLPLIVAGIHVIAASPLIARLLELMNLYNIRLYVMCTAGCFLIFGIMYVLIYTLTAGTYYRIVSK